MKYIESEKNLDVFLNIRKGETFFYENNYWMRLDADKDFNATLLTGPHAGNIDWFDDNDEVEIVDLVVSREE